MKGVKRISSWVVSAFMLQGCFWFDDQNQIPLAGKYYTETAADTKTILYFDDESTEAFAPLLSNVSAVSFSETHVAIRDEEQYFLFQKNAVSYFIAKQTAIGPLDLRAFRKQLKQLGIDSTLHLSSDF
ncbi:hypothetical protein [Hymenobacter sp. B1770]|uniref:hypothetical protein n=1 Tax=Hymenobacter sp. B1770 TaxID=1718788 RepID=UPI003CF9FD7A